MSNIQIAMETELPLWGEQSNGPRKQGDQRLEWQEAAAEACPQEGVPKRRALCSESLCMGKE